MTSLAPPTFDVSAFPAILAADTSFLIRALQNKHEDDGLSAHLLQAFQRERVSVIVPAIGFGEYAIKATVALPKSRFIRVVSFDRLSVAEFLRIGADLLKRLQKEHGGRTIIRNDAMIVAAAKRHRAESIITTDPGPHMRAACEALGLRLVTPEAFQKQLSLATKPADPQVAASVQQRLAPASAPAEEQEDVPGYTTEEPAPAPTAAAIKEAERADNVPAGDVSGGRAQASNEPPAPSEGEVGVAPTTGRTAP